MGMDVNVKPNMYNVTLTTANTEYSQALSVQSKYFSIKLRDTTSKLRIAFVTGKVAASTAPFMTIAPGASYSPPEKMSNGGLTLYLATDTDGAIAEILEWADIIS